MVISQAQPLLLLLVSLFVLPVLGVTKFQTCNTGHQYPVEVTGVEIYPNPVKSSKNNEKITITGYTNKDITEDVTVNLGLSIGMFFVSKKSYSLCDITACPVAPGPFVLTFTNVFTKKEKRARAYYVSISITEKQETEPMMCVWFACGISRGYASLFNQVTR